MDVSIVVSTWNRAQRIAELFPHYGRIASARRWEAVFVDNGSTDGTHAELVRCAGESRLPVTVLLEPRPGASAGRNAGWRHARGALVAFTDHDCYPAPDYVDCLWDCFADPGLAWLGGRVLRYDPHDYLVTILNSTEREAIPPRSFVRPGIVHGANMALRRAVLEEVGGFDERMGPGTAVPSGEDLDLLARASGLGHRGAYDPRPAVFHHHGRTQPAEVSRLMASYDLGRGAYYAKSLVNARTRRAYLWPAARRIAGNLCRGDFGVMRREFSGAWTYFRG